MGLLNDALGTVVPAPPEDRAQAGVYADYDAGDVGAQLAVAAVVQLCADIPAQFTYWRRIMGAFMGRITIRTRVASAAMFMIRWEVICAH